MTQVKLLTPRVLANGQTQDAGETIAVEPREAQRLIAAGQAWPVDATPAPPAGRGRRESPTRT